MTVKSITIEKTSNGFMTLHNNIPREEEYDPPCKKISSSFESFDSLSSFLRGLFGGNGCAGFNRFRKEDFCEVGETPEKMRDELGELRRFRVDAIKRGNEQNETIHKLTDSADYWRSKYSDQLAMTKERDAVICGLEEVIAKLKTKKSKTRKR